MQPTFSQMEIAALLLLALLLGSFIRNIADTLWSKWTKDYVERTDFEEYKKYVQSTFQKKNDHDEDFKKILQDMEEVKKLIVIIAVKLNVDISKANLTIPLEDLKEVINHEKKKEV